MGLLTELRANVSIHASAREATAEQMAHFCNLFVSIHASAREATAILQDKLIVHLVSIHASAREATANLHKIDHHFL